MRPLPPRTLQLSRVRPVVLSSTFGRNIRAFHATRSSPLIAEVLSASTGFLHYVHDISGLTWATSIPLTAVIVRSLVAFPLQIYSRKRARRQGDILPLVVSYRKYYEKVMKNQKTTDKIFMRPDQAEQKLRQTLKVKTNMLYSRWNVSKYPQLIPLLQIPVWLSLMEGIRAMCGVNVGILRYLLPMPNKDDGGPALPGTEPTLASEGALWFPDLLVGDPTGILPVLLGLSIIGNVQSGWKTKSLAETSDFSEREMIMSLASKSMKVAFTGLGIWIAVSAYASGMPAGMMLYWIASSNTATLQSRLLERYMFASKPLESWTKKYVRTLKIGEKPPPKKSLLP
ncbi:putative mitochondrial export translocase Oxa2 [Talaromyces proteolyticus]|uniref:Mitochondrial export translocase Oxa2 n=1 Tax=Talaromyces proteolyticus TaxID=1131652 RepID=A0AAD4Q0D0_9EURO|nr:putative mitochondrial export translocase Oxa2 [Talaromyces proteolyticus]KAH8697156.1 putative mitochondrial export translocase Oxa2 [Talaromyces proteolyticus]